MQIDWIAIVSSLTVIGFVYGFLNNFKTDVNAKLDKFDARMDRFENKINSIEERMFWMATGKKLEDAILEERLKREAP